MPWGLTQVIVFCSSQLSSTLTALTFEVTFVSRATVCGVPPLTGILRIEPASKAIRVNST